MSYPSSKSSVMLLDEIPEVNSPTIVSVPSLRTTIFCLVVSALSTPSTSTFSFGTAEIPVSFPLIYQCPLSPIEGIKSSYDGEVPPPPEPDPFLAKAKAIKSMLPP
jgi:hypothetical protein